MVKQLWMRTVRLYLYHVMLLGFAFMVVAHLAAGSSRPALHNLLDFYFVAPKQAVMDGILLLYRPPLLDILPMYITFLVVTPVVLTLTTEESAGTSFWVSGSYFGWQLSLDFDRHSSILVSNTSASVSHSAPEGLSICSPGSLCGLSVFIVECDGPRMNCRLKTGQGGCWCRLWWLSRSFALFDIWSDTALNSACLKCHSTNGTKGLSGLLILRRLRLCWYAFSLS